ncbi:MAG: hypothetical protein WCD04_12315 [Terriglobia bacterium]
MKKLEEKQADKSISTSQIMELSPSHRRILNEDAPKLWDRITDCLYNALSTCQIQGITSSFDRPSAHIVSIQIFRKASALPAVKMLVRFVPEDYEIRSAFPVPTEPHTPRVFRFTVSGGRVSLSEGATPLPDSGEDIAEVVCQRLLEPLLESFI